MQPILVALTLIGNQFMNKRSFTTPEAATYLGVSECLLKKSRMKNSLAREIDAPKPTYLSCRRVVYLIEDMNKWLDSHKSNEDHANENSQENDND